MVDSPYYLLQSNTTDYSHPKVQGGFRYSPKQQYVSNSSKISTDWDYNYRYMYMQATNSSDGDPAYVIWSLSDSAISLASYKTLYVNVTVTDADKSILVAPILGLSTSGSVTSNNFNSSLTFSSEITDATYSLNISSLNSTYWFYLYQAVQDTGSRGSSGSKITFFEIYLVA